MNFNCAQGVQPRYYLGDQLTATCSTDPAYPEPVIKWWINGHAADTKHVTRSGHFKARTTLQKIILPIVIKILNKILFILQI